MIIVKDSNSEQMYKVKKEGPYIILLDIFFMKLHKHTYFEIVRFLFCS